MSKRINDEEKAKTYLKELEGVFNADEMAIIKTIFVAIKPSIGPDYYEDAINNCCKTLIENKKEGKEFDPSVPVRETYKETEFTSSIIPLRMLANGEESYSDEEKHDVEAMKHKIYLEYVDTKNIKKIAKGYNLSVETVIEIIDEARANKRVEEMQSIIDGLESSRRSKR